jgi:hypothetical protein
MCRCPSGTDGEYCEADHRMDCSLRPCQNGGKCEVRAGGIGYICKCPGYRGGKNCERYDPDVSVDSVLCYDFRDLPVLNQSV